MAQTVEVERPLAIVEEDVADDANGNVRTAYDAELASDPDVVVYRISGAFFFGAAVAVGAALRLFRLFVRREKIPLWKIPNIEITISF